MNTKTIILGVAAALACTSAGASAQDEALLAAPGSPRFAVGLSGLGAMPRGAFADRLDHAFGLGADARMRLDRTGRLALRLDAEVLQRGWGGPDVVLPVPVEGMRSLSLSTRNTVVLVQLGPEFSGSVGGVEPYVGVGAGASWFVTDASGHLRDGRLGVMASLWQQDVAFVVGARAGARVPVRGRAAVDLGVEYQRGGEADFVPEGGLALDGRGGIVIQPVPTRADMLVFRAGVSVALGGSRSGSEG